MIPFVNIHSHHEDARPEVCTVLSMEPSAFMKSDRNEPFVSIGHHPWKVGLLSKMELTNMAQLLQLKQVVAVGEIGLDKLCESDFHSQLELFQSQLRMAACVHKPVVVHCVKAWDELLQVLSRIDNLPPVVIHGFRGKPQQAGQLMRHGCILSFGPHYNVETLAVLPVGSFFLETDDDESADIVDLYKLVSKVKNVDVEDLKKAVFALYEKITTVTTASL